MPKALPATVRACVWTSDLSFEKAPAWLRDAKERRAVRLGVLNAPNLYLEIPTPMGIDQCKPGWIVVLDVNGGLRAMSKAEFDEKYQLAGQEPEPVQDVTSILGELLDERRVDGGRTVITLDDVISRADKSAHKVISNVYSERTSDAAPA